ncbi:MAG: outer membrane lipoprotein carrier protein LolA [Azospirillaceae bacterium]
MEHASPHSRRRSLPAALALAAVLATGAAVALAPSPAPAQGGGAPGLSAQDRRTVEQVEDYLEGLDTLEARFVQIASGSRLEQGTVWLDRPGRMRIEYDDLPHLIVADGFWLTFWDGELEQRSDVPLSEHPAGLLVREDVELSGDVRVDDVAYGPASTRVTLVRAQDPGAGSLTLVFEGRADEGDAIALDRWVFLDAQGKTVEVDLLDARPGADVADVRFAAPRPPADRRD